MSNDKKIEKAIEYATSSSLIENMNPTKDELLKIKKMLQESQKKNSKEKNNGKTK